MNAPHRTLLDRWPSIRCVATDAECDYHTAARWFARGRVPSGYWLALTIRGRERRIEVTVDEFARAVAPEWAQAYRD